MLENYIIVGRRLDDEFIKYLHGEGTAEETIDENHEKDGVPGTPLTVEFIGRKMVELSEAPPLRPGTAEYDRATHLLKQAITVRPPSGHDPMDPELDKIWQKTTIVLDYDERAKAEGETDRNVRKLVVPVPDTLAYRQAQLAAQGSITGFVPPLTYDLDQMLMKAYFGNLFGQIVADFTDDNGQPFSEDTQTKLLTMIDDRFGSADDLTDSDDPVSKNMLDILNSPVSAFHRAVGIYITEMCN